MEPYTVIQLEKHRTAYSHFAILYNALNDFSYNQDTETTNQLSAITQLSQVGMPLPSGRYGNALAVALEMQFYQGALFMIKNAEELGINLASVSSEYGGRNVWDLPTTFEFSKRGFKMTKLQLDDPVYKDYPTFINNHNRDVDSAIEISNILQDGIKRQSK